MNAKPDLITRPNCPYCNCERTVKNGSTHHKKPKYLCKNCKKQFIKNPTKKPIPLSKKNKDNR
ncbi:IS1/IS1595 family N-terminal zinc-binding domain-containing protein [Moorena producens]|uniref:IS1/IS1595 family N-terminal zinc-binding domain-containing protein n=1 Tax=Moorena producens TaxID=1155739 RepID=UPI003F6A4410